MPAFRPLLPLALASAGLAGGVLGARPAATGQPASPTRAAGGAAILGAHDPAWSPAGPRIALSIRDQLWTLGADGRDPRAVVRWPDRAAGFERDPAWSPDGRKLAFAARLDDSGFDLYVVDAGGGEPRRVTSLAGDERWPSWLPDGRLVFANRGHGQWDLHAVDPETIVAGRRAADRHHQRRNRAARLARRPPRGVRVDRRRRGRRGGSLAAPAERPRRRDGEGRDAARPDAADPGTRGRVVAGVGAGRRTAGLRGDAGRCRIDPDRRRRGARGRRRPRRRRTRAADCRVATPRPGRLVAGRTHAARHGSRRAGSRLQRSAAARR